MTDADITTLLADLDAKREKACPLPWECGGIVEISTTFDKEVNIFPPPASVTGGYQHGGPVAVVSANADNGGVATGEFVTLACNSIPTLVAEIRQLRRERDEAGCS